MHSSKTVHNSVYKSVNPLLSTAFDESASARTSFIHLYNQFLAARRIQLYPRHIQPQKGRQHEQQR